MTSDAIKAAWLLAGASLTVLAVAVSVLGVVLYLALADLQDTRTLLRLSEERAKICETGMVRTHAQLQQFEKWLDLAGQRRGGVGGQP